ncbi:acyl-coenzyme A thioesterase PaaI-like protein [Marinobacterium halophilum]|uniref:Acyl-coenzyme A thioesterase PaaI-like protein n=1 Tax=Marinobacterium halophilum TaxID=267374 RepID=A0A2P8F0G5_9GAMM|nr:PaaI family thioesterase [Marinobacterium halophilum]PSL15212.1 acyl-coenzyme A thioesterase PaaI-like protein [Marinobacterium halophilum]
MQQLLELVTEAKASGDYQPLVELIPYARILGVQCECYGEEIIFRLPAKADNIGNPTVPAIHGGVIASFMELTALFQLTLQLPQPGLAKIIDFSLDYMRAGLDRDTFAVCHISRQGRRVGNCSVLAWQERKSRPIAQARAHFLLDRGN